MYRALYTEVHDLYSSPNVISVITSSRMRSAGNGAGTGENRYGTEDKNLKDSDHSYLDGEIRLKWILKG